MRGMMVKAKDLTMFRVHQDHRKEKLRRQNTINA